MPVEEHGDRMFILQPLNHHAARDQLDVSKKRFASPRKHQLENQVEIWPHLVAKAKAKSLGCYERLLEQDILTMLADLTGMPVKKVDMSVLDFKWLREGFMHGCLMLCKARTVWVSRTKQEATEGTSNRELEYWSVSQAQEMPDGRMMIEVKNHFCTKTQKKGLIVINLRMEYRGISSRVGRLDEIQEIQEERKSLLDYI